MFDIFCCKVGWFKYAKGLLGCYICLVISKGNCLSNLSNIHNSPGICMDHIFGDFGSRLRQLMWIYGFYEEERSCFQHNVTVGCFLLVIHLCSFHPRHWLECPIQSQEIKVNSIFQELLTENIHQIFNTEF